MARQLNSMNFQYPFAFSFRAASGFDSFLVAPANTELLAMLHGFETGPQPFCFLWGAGGSGKTHLLQAMCHESSSAIYLPLKELAQHGPACLDGLADSGFLVFDDIDAVLGEPAWEEQLFSLFNLQQGSGGKLCMAASGNPQSLQTCLPDLRSRLQLALVYELKALDEAARAEVVRERAALRGIELGPELLAFLLTRSPRGMDDLMQMLEKLDTLSLAEKRRITIPFIKDTFGW